ncbi:helix-turn-helix domain-containing protein [Bradyrhizobium neotropicale]|uniref:helix-turn-helix domain-containing protein n=1 Tax=Bradyrhizobium neotropicale TaxID=1497615 RepID=UPI0009EEAECF|nr:helix-turn-helix transcriptional regulator [Bradyrhizobium neotropicale]
MADLRKRFGELLAGHRRRRGMTQEDLAEAAGLSVDMISKIEAGATGARFPTIERLAQAVQVDPAELFTSHLPAGSMNRGAFGEISSKLSSLSDSDLVWISALLDVALRRGREQSLAKTKRPSGRTVAKSTRSPVLARKKNG